MSTIEWFKKNRLVITIFITAVIITSLIPSEGKFKYEYNRGRPWLYETLVAPIDIPILKTELELRVERNKKAAGVIPYYRYVEKIRSEQQKVISDELQPLNNQVYINFIKSSIDKVYEKGIVNDFPDTNILSKIIIIQKEKENVETPALEVFTKSSAFEYVKRKILEEFPENDNLNSLIESKLNRLLVPNLILDNNATQIAHKRAVSNISPTKGVLYTGQLIVAKGETITADIEQLLDSYKAEYEISMGFLGSLYLLKFGHFISVMGILLLFVILMHFLKKEVLVERNKLNFMMLQAILIVLVTVIVKNINPAYLYLVPFPVFAIFITSFFTSKIVIPIYLTFLLPVVLIAQSGYEIFFLNALAGGVVVYTFTYWNRGWLQFLNSIVIFLTLTIFYVSFRLIEYGSFTGVNYKYFIYFLWNSVLIKLHPSCLSV